MRTAQEIFTQIKNHLLKQGKKAQSGRLPDCQYHCADGSRCAVGVLIEPQFYQPWMECGRVGLLIAELRKREVDQDLLNELVMHEDLLYSLQIVHDNRDVEFWETELRKVANKFNLEYDEAVFHSLMP